MVQTGEARRQQAYRARKAATAERMRVALEAIVSRLDGNDKPVAVELRGIALAGLGRAA